MRGLIREFPQAATRRRARFCRFSRGCYAPARRVWRCFLAEGLLRSATLIPSAYRRYALGKQTKGEGLGSRESPLLTDQQARDASPDQLEDLVEQINLALRGLALRERGLPGLARDQQPGVVPGDPAPGESPENPASD